MPFNDAKWDLLLPAYLLENDKNRLREHLSQFFGGVHRAKEKQYDDFYHTNPPAYYLQGDLIKNINALFWDTNTDNYKFQKTGVVLLSNTCDVQEDNERIIIKQALYAPIVLVDFFMQSLKQNGCDENKIKSVYTNLKDQAYSNLFYLPPNPKNGREYIIILDNIFWQPVKVLQSLIPTITENRLFSLGHFGLYLFISKLSYHFCRIPEEDDKKRGKSKN